MTGRPALVLALIAGLVAVAAAGKLTRYGAPRVAVATGGGGDASAVASALAAAGWRLVATEAGDRIPFVSLRFARESCRHRIAIGLLGTSTELVALVGMVHGGDVAFVEAGRLVDATAVTSRRLGRLRDLTAADTAPKLPLLAIAPAAVLRQSGCGVPFEDARKLAGNLGGEG